MLRLLLGQRLIKSRLVLHASVSAFMILYEDARLVARPIRVYENALVRARPWEHWRRLHGTWQARPADQDLTEGLHGVKAIGLMVCNDHRAAHRLRAGDAGASSLSGTEPALFSLSSSLFPLL